MERVTGTRFADGMGSPGTGAGAVIGLVATALAACNRAACYEIMSVAAKMGMKLGDFGEIVNHGSAWSRECETILAELASNAAPQTRTLGMVVAALRELEDLNTASGVSTVMLGAVRAVYESAAHALGPDRTVDKLASLYERAGSVTFTL